MKTKILGFLAAAFLVGPMATQAATFGLSGNFGTTIYFGPLNGGTFSGTYEFDGTSVGAFDISLFDAGNNVLANLTQSNATSAFFANDGGGGVDVFQFVSINDDPRNVLAIGFAAGFNGIGAMLAFGDVEVYSYGFAGIRGSAADTDSIIVSGSSFAVPEPGTLALLGLGLAGLGLSRRRKAA